MPFFPSLGLGELLLIDKIESSDQIWESLLALADVVELLPPFENRG